MTGDGLVPAVALIAAAFAAATYFLGGRPARPLLVAALARAAAWASIVALLLNPACPAAPVDSPRLVLLDTSLSLSAAGGQASRARALADSLGEVVPFGGSRLRGPLLAAAGSGRPLVVLTDGELVDASELPPELLSAAEVLVLPREPVPDRAIVEVQAARWIQARDTLVVQAAVAALGGASFSDSIMVEVRAAGAVLARRPVPAGPGGRVTVALPVAADRLGRGDLVLEVVLVGAEDAEPRTDRRLHLVTVTPAPGIVLLAGAPDWESRFLWRTIREVAGLPVRGYLQVQPDRWHEFGTLTPVGAAGIRDAARTADLLVVMGEIPAALAAGGGRARWDWPAAQPTPGDWYLAAVPSAPTVSGLAAIPPDSLPPATALAALAPPPGGWTLLVARQGRRGPERPAAISEVREGRRQVTVGASGIWRWAFRGGLAEEAYRLWVAETITWLLAAELPGGARLRVARPVVPRDEPLVFQRLGADSARTLPLTWAGESGPRTDTLAFDGSGRALATLPPGIWRYRAGRDSGTVAVEGYSPELLPAARTLEPSGPAVRPAAPGRPVREVPWFYLVPVLAWSLEWGIRRRAGLR